jgi:cyclophilin family peptidyl-prolyl cis-trans isomerase
MSSIVLNAIAVPRGCPVETRFESPLRKLASLFRAKPPAVNSRLFPLMSHPARFRAALKSKEAGLAEIKDPENTIIMTLKDGDVVIELMPAIAPKHVERMKELARAGAYDNVCFHRVIEGFMAQSGDVANGNMERNFNLRRAGTGGSDLPDLPAEFSRIPHDRGTLGAARSQNPNSANSQFFINFKDNHFLNGQYTVYGRVISGMEFVDRIVRGEPPQNPDRMVKVRVAADVA